MSVRRPSEETARLGEDINERDLHPRLESGRRGYHVAIDVSCGNWVVADTLLAAATLLRAKHPPIVDVWTVWIEQRTLHRTGGAWGLT